MSIFRDLLWPLCEDKMVRGKKPGKATRWEDVVIQEKVMVAGTLVRAEGL